MIRLGRLTDYGIVLVTYMARSEAGSLHTARDLASAAQLPLPTVSKLLKELSQGGVLSSHRGVKGGYSLARPPRQIAVAEIIAALEGPIGMTECSAGVPGLCDLEPHCPISTNWRVISNAVRDALEKVTVADLIVPVPVAVKNNELTTLTLGSGRTQ